MLLCNISPNIEEGFGKVADQEAKGVKFESPRERDNELFAILA